MELGGSSHVGGRYPEQEARTLIGSSSRESTRIDSWPLLEEM
jgi:hypothetical protein